MSALPEHVRAALFTDHDAVVRDCRAYVPVKVIAARYGLTLNAVKVIRKQAGIFRPLDKRGRPKLTPEQEIEIPTLYATGLSMEAIARTFGIATTKRIRQVLAEHNVTVYPVTHGWRYVPPAPRPLVTEAEIAAFEAYLTDRQYARSTRQNLIRLLRMAVAGGTVDPEDVDEKFPDKMPAYRGDIRRALRRFGEFRRVT